MAADGNIGMILMETEVPERASNFVWIIPNFFSLSSEYNTCYYSPSFAFAGNSWSLQIYPHGDQKNVGYISLYLRKTSPGPCVQLEFSLGLKTMDGKKFLEHYRTHGFKKENKGKGFCHVVLRSDLLSRDNFSPTDPLKIFCSFKYPKVENSASMNSANRLCPHCKMTLLDRNALSHEKSCLVKCPKCSDDVLLQRWYEHNCQGTSTKDDESLCQDYKKMLLEGSHHDLILRVGDREFRAHRDILKARSTVFWSMLDLDMKEKNSDSVDIPDCSSAAMEQFLLYIYSGKVEILDQRNMLGLYYIADKYDVRGLKEECRDFIKNSLSVTNICEIIKLAMNHCDSILLEKATEYFGGNMLGVMRTVEWQAFMRDNSTVANELLIKSIEKSNNAK